jgi:predicted RNase H-like HicB family nuclease
MPVIPAKAGTHRRPVRVSLNQIRHTEKWVPAFAGMTVVGGLCYHIFQGGEEASLRYPVKLTRDDNGTLMVTAPDFPEVATFGEDEGDALIRAADAIATAIQAASATGSLFPVLRARVKGSAWRRCPH